MLLNCHTHYSFHYGIFSVDELLYEVQQKGYSHFVLSDINNTSGIMDALRLAGGYGLQALAGIDFRNGIHQQYVGIARNNEGFYQLNEYLSKHLHVGKEFDSIAEEFADAFIVYPLSKYTGHLLRENEFIGIAPEELRMLPFSKWRNLTRRMVVLHPVTFSGKSHFNAHRLLRAIDQNVLLSKLDPSEQTSAHEVMPYKNELYAFFGSYPEIIANTEYMLNSCSVQFDFGKMKNKNFSNYTSLPSLYGKNGSVKGDMELLRREAYDGIFYRYGNFPSEEILQRIEKELGIIGDMGFASYFLINWDIVRYARSKDYYYVGRGSGSNSMLAYLLRITDVDPVELDLYFERFINNHRSTPPDFDIDFSWLDRDDMTRYIFKRFGEKGRVALLGSYNTFQRDAVIRELGKVFGLPGGEIDRLQRIEKHEADSMGKLVLKYSELIKGIPNHLSIHASGILISEKPIHYYCATNLPPKGYPTTQFSMLEAEDVGLFKFDILSQRGVAKIKDALTLIEQNKGVSVDIHKVSEFKEDPKVKSLLSKGKAIGCFYIESPAMRMLLSKLEADDYLRLVAASSIIRPGVAKSGMMREYILRYRNPKLREKARQEIPELYELLEETYGVMVYQEDVIKIAHYFAGLSLADADYLRRGMSWKFKQRNEFYKVQEKFFINCRAKGYAEATIENIWNQIESFANFAFSKGHSASYAVESYQALFLKAYFPLEYMTATLNNGGGFYRPEVYVHEARMHGAKVELPCVNKSEELCVIDGETIYLGLGMLGELSASLVEAVVMDRKQNGPFVDLVDFIQRIPVSIEQIRILIRADTFRFTGINRKKLMWDAHAIINPMKKIKAHEELFEIETKSFKIPDLEDSWVEKAFDEMEIFGFSLYSPFRLLRERISSTLTARQLPGYIGKTITIIGYLVTRKNTGTSKGENMHFGTFLDIEGNWIDTVHFPPSVRQYPFTGPGCYKLTGKVTMEFDFITLDVSEQKRLPLIDREKITAEDVIHPGAEEGRVAS